MADDPRPPSRSLPVTWGTGSDGKGGFQHAIHDRAAVIQEPSINDIAVFADQRATTCGSCKHFRPPEKDRPEIKGFLARAIYEAGWKLGYMGADPKDITRCREDPKLAVSVNSKSCGHYTPSRGSIR